MDRLSDRSPARPTQQRIREAVCPECGATVSVTYWPLGWPLYSEHRRLDKDRDCRRSLRPVEQP